MVWLRFCASVVLSGITAVASLPAVAADLTAPPPPPVFMPPPPVANPYGIISEVRGALGAHGVIDHECCSLDVDAQVLTVKPYSFAPNSIWNYFVPRFHLGGDLNTAGKTDQIFAGATWDFPIYQRFFGELTFGGSYNDGHAGYVVPTDYSRVGCHGLFRETGSVGYHLTEHWNIMATFEHSSNAGFCKHNEGLTNAELALGYVF
jgi:hypothetical protein